MTFTHNLSIKLQHAGTKGTPDSITVYLIKPKHIYITKNFMQQNWKILKTFEDCIANTLNFCVGIQYIFRNITLNEACESHVNIMTPWT